MYYILYRVIFLNGYTMLKLNTIGLLPPCVSKDQGFDLLKSITNVSSLIGELKSELKYSIVSKQLVYLFSLKESVQSTRIEGTQVTFSDMFDSNLSNKKEKEIQEVVNYNRALTYGIELIHKNMPFSTRLIKDLHSILIKNAIGTKSASGEYRKVQNFIGPDNNIDHAVYIPISADKISLYMENLEYYANREFHKSFNSYSDKDLYIINEKAPALLMLAIMHAQFESIHPFLDGNGRMGRILIALMAVKYKLVDSPVFLVSEELEKERARYYDLLNAVRGTNPDWYSWLKFFISCSERMAKNLILKIQNSHKLANDGISSCTIASQQDAYLSTFTKCCITVKELSNLKKMSEVTARKALNALADKGLLYSEKTVKRNKRYLNYDLKRILDA